MESSWSPLVRLVYIRRTKVRPARVVVLYRAHLIESTRALDEKVVVGLVTQLPVRFLAFVLSCPADSFITARNADPAGCGCGVRPQAV